MPSKQYISTHFKDEAREYFNRKLQAHLELRREKTANTTFRFVFDFLSSNNKDCSTIINLYMDENGTEILKKSVRILTDESQKNLPEVKRDDNIVAFRNEEEYEMQTSIQFKDCFDETSEEKLSKYRKEAKLLRQCLDKNFWDLSLEIDEFIGVPISNETAKWNRLVSLRERSAFIYQVLVVLAYLWNFYLGIQDAPNNVMNYIVAICVSLFAAWISNLVWHIFFQNFACAIMSKDFYEQSPRGRLLLHDSVHKTPSELKSKSLVWAFVQLLIVLAIPLAPFLF